MGEFHGKEIVIRQSDETIFFYRPYYDIVTFCKHTEVDATGKFCKKCNGIGVVYDKLYEKLHRTGFKLKNRTNDTILVHVDTLKEMVENKEIVDAKSLEIAKEIINICGDENTHNGTKKPGVVRNKAWKTNGVKSTDNSNKRKRVRNTVLATGDGKSNG